MLLFIGENNLLKYLTKIGFPGCSQIMSQIIWEVNDKFCMRYAHSESISGNV